MGFLKNIIRNIADAASAEKLHSELYAFKAVYDHRESHVKEELLVGVVNFLSTIAKDLRNLTPDQRVLAGIEIYQGQFSRLRSGYKVDAFSRWVVGAYLISNNLASSEKQRQVQLWTTDIVEKATN